MTPEQERAVLQATELGIEKELEAAYEKLVALIRAGTPPRDAVQQVMDGFTPKYAELLSVAFSGVMAQAVGKEAAMSMQVGTVQLSQKLYAQAAYVSDVTTGIVDRHVKGFQDARALALELFEGYGFRPPDAEPLKLSPSNPALPKYLREALLTDGGIQSDFARAFAKMQVDGLKTQALRAAYSDVLKAISDAETGKGAALLEKRLKTAFYERMRYFANRIAQTELHRAYSLHVAKLIMDDEDIEFVQIQRSPGSTSVCICSLIAGRDKYGMGKGVYPKRAAPVPGFHPFCRCKISPRLDLTGKQEKPVDENSDRYFLSRVGEPMAARIMGSKDRADQAIRSGDALAVANSRVDPVHQIKAVAGPV